MIFPGWSRADGTIRVGEYWCEEQKVNLELLG